MVNTRSGLAVIVTSCLAAVGAGGFSGEPLQRRAGPADDCCRPGREWARGANPAEAAQPVHETEAVMDEGPESNCCRQHAGAGSAAVSAPKVTDKRPSREQKAAPTGGIDRWQRGSVLRPPTHARRLRPSGRESGCFASADRACRPLDARSAGGGRLSNRPATR